MDYLTVCYESQWHLFRDSPGTTTRGRYYFSAPDAIDYPGFHHWGSRDWRDRNWQNVQGLGESVSAPHTFASGLFDGRFPEQRPSGPLLDAEQGSLLDDASQDGDLFNGYPLVCYLPPPRALRDIAQIPLLPLLIEPLEGFQRGSAFFRCQVQRLWARVIDWLYEDNAPMIANTLRAFFGEGPVINVHAAEQNFPSVVTVVTPDWVCVAADGTREFLTLAFQGFQSLGGPANQGAISTVPLWLNAARWIDRKMGDDGVNDNRPVFLAGHSYGAAACVILAALFRHWSPSRVVKYLTYGCPKVGDDRVAALLRRCDGLSIANDNDFVTSIPPDRITSAALVPFFPLINFGLLADWERPEGTTQQDGDGGLRPGPPVALDFATLLGMVTRIVAAQDPSPVLGHPISEYERRISLRCPDPGWPVSVEVNDMMDSEDTGGPAGIRVSGTTGNPDADGGLAAEPADSGLAPADGGLVAEPDDTGLAPADGGLEGGDG